MTDNAQNLTREVKPDFSAQDLQELVGAAPWVFYTMELAESMYDQAKDAHKEKDYAKYLCLWSNFIDLHHEKSEMGLDNPRQQVPLRYFYKQDACEHFWSNMEYMISMADFANRYWEDNIKGTLKLSVQMLLATAIDKD